MSAIDSVARYAARAINRLVRRRGWALIETGPKAIIHFQSFMRSREEIGADQNAQSMLRRMAALKEAGFKPAVRDLGTQPTIRELISPGGTQHDFTQYVKD